MAVGTLYALSTSAQFITPGTSFTAMLALTCAFTLNKLHIRAHEPNTHSSGFNIFHFCYFVVFHCQIKIYPVSRSEKGSEDESICHHLRPCIAQCQCGKHQRGEVIFCLKQMQKVA